MGSCKADRSRHGTFVHRDAQRLSDHEPESLNLNLKRPKCFNILGLALTASIHVKGSPAVNEASVLHEHWANGPL